MATILGIESSCDETSVAVCVNGEIRSNIIATQAVHQHYGGVVPELASRAHQQNIVPAVQEALSTANISKNELSAIAFTRGPGLLGSLLVGTSFAKGFALAKNLPLIEVNHMQAHILAHFIDSPKPSFPFLCLTVSGGHTQIVLVKNYFDMEVLGSTIDDAAGEAFDKTAKILGLPYPGGPLVPQADMYRGDALTTASDTTGAARAYLDAFSASQTGPLAGQALTKLGQALGKLGQGPEACVTLAEVGKRFPGSSDEATAKAAMAAQGCP